MTRSHLACWDSKEGLYQHVCQVPAGKPCHERGCEKEAGTWWTPHWCPDHDVKRQDRISAQLEKLQNDLRFGTMEAEAS